MSQEIFSTDFADESSVSTLEWTRKPLKVEFGSQDGKGIKVFMVKYFLLQICSSESFQVYKSNTRCAFRVETLLTSFLTLLTSFLQER